MNTRKKAAKKVTKKKTSKKLHPNWGGKRIPGVGKKYKKTARKRTKKNIIDEVLEDLESATAGIKLLQKEKNIPIPPGKIFGESEQLKDKLHKLGSSMIIGESFVIPIKKKAFTAKYLYHTFKKNTFRIRKIEDNPEYGRVWLIR